MNRLKLLIWKNLKKQTRNRSQFIISILMPVFFFFLMVVLRLVVVIPNEQNVKSFNTVDLNIWYRDVIRGIQEKRKAMILEKPEFKDNIFVPNLKLVVAPNNSIALKSILLRLKDLFSDLKVEEFDTCENLRHVLHVRNHLAGVCFNLSDKRTVTKFYPLILDFTVIMPAEYRIYKDTYIGASWDTAANYDRYHSMDERAAQSDDGGPPGYLREGVASIIYFVASSYFYHVSKRPTLPDILLKRFDVTINAMDKLSNGFEVSFSLIPVIGFMYPVVILTMLIVHERECKQRHLLNTSGINNWCQLLAWYINGLIPLSITFLSSIFMLKVTWNGENSVIDKCPVVVVMLFFLAYILALVAFCILMSSICTRTKTAIALVPLIWIVSFLPFFTTPSNEDVWDLRRCTMLIFLNVALAAGMKRLIQFERFPDEFTLKQYLELKITHYDVSLLSIILLLLCQAVLYHVLAILLDSDTHAGFVRFFKRRFLRCQRKSRDHQRSQPENVRIQGSDDIKTVVLELKNLSLMNKGYKQHAVNDISLKLHENEILVIVGHNTAGKTTIMKLICGLIKPTKGKILIRGHDVQLYPSKAYAHVAYSLRSVELFKEFTVAQQLTYFSRIRGLTKAEAKQDVEEYMNVMKLQHLANVRTESLTNGQLQLLDILCAFAGRKRIVLLDKPLQDIDSHHRHLFYKFLETQRVNRSILITTNTPKLAEKIGDHIAIICAGELKAAGSLHFLNENYKDGYRLICQRGEHCSVPLLTAFLMHHVPKIVREGDRACNTTYIIDYEDAEQLKTLLDELPERKRELDLNNYRLTDTTLENVVSAIHASALGTDQTGFRDDDMQEMKLTISKKQRLSGVRLFFSHIWTMVQKRFLLDVRHPMLPLIQILLPMFLTFLIFVTPHIDTERRYDIPGIEFSLSRYSNTKVIYEVAENRTVVRLSVAALKRDIASARGDHEAIRIDHEPIMHYVQKMVLQEYLLNDYKFLVAFSFSSKTIIAWYNNYLLHTAPLGLTIALNAVAGAYVNKDARVKVAMEVMPFSTTHYTELRRGVHKLDNVLVLMLSFCFGFIWSFPLLLLTLRNVKRYNKVESIAGMQIGRLAIATTVYEFSKIAFSLIPMNSMIILFNFHKFKQLHVFLTFSYIVLLIGLCIISINLLLVELISDARSSYTLAVVFHSFCIVAFLALFEIHEFNPVEDEKVVPNFNFLPYFALPNLLVRLLSSADIETICADSQTFVTAKILENCAVAPNCCNPKNIDYFKDLLPIIIIIILSWSLYFLWKQYFFQQHVRLRRRAPFDNYPNNYYDHYLRHFTLLDERDKSWVYEKIRVRNLERARLLVKPLFCENVGVRIGNQIILNRLNFMMERYQFFVVLGQNGTGKSVLIETILGECYLSNGHINIDYSDNAYDIRRVYKRIGYCPQDDALMEGLTLMETIEFVLRIRGLPRLEAISIALNICRVFDVFPYRYHTVKTCSRGIIKRVSIAIAMIGYASLILLDDPFSPLDENGKRIILNVIAQVCARGQAVFTSSVDPAECELMHRVAVLKDRHFCAIGELHTQLLLNYYNDYIVVILKFRLGELMRRSSQPAKGDPSYKRLHLENTLQRERLKMAAYMEENFPQVIVKDITFNVVTGWFSTTNYTFGSIFSQLHENSKEFYTFSISTPTLDTLFMDYAEKPDYESELISKRKQPNFLPS